MLTPWKHFTQTALLSCVVCCSAASMPGTKDLADASEPTDSSVRSDGVVASADDSAVSDPARDGGSGLQDGSSADSASGPSVSAPMPTYTPPPIVTRSALGALSLRGVNYLPSRHPFPGIWREDLAPTFAQDMKRVRELGGNVVRTFLFYDTEANLVDGEGKATPRYRQRVLSLLDAAEKERIRVILCLPKAPFFEGVTHGKWRVFLESMVPHFANDARILMWDLINEPGDNEGPESSDALVEWMRFTEKEVARLAPKHMTTIGVAYQTDQLVRLGFKPTIHQYHQYSGGNRTTVASEIEARQSLIGSTPLFIGEFGYGSQGRPDASKARQEEIVRHVLQASADRNVLGALPWNFVDFLPDWMGEFEQHFGMYDVDYALKPAGTTIKNHFEAWRRTQITAWEYVPGTKIANALPDGRICARVPGDEKFTLARKSPWTVEQMYDIARLYCGIFDRLPDAGGFAYWLDLYQQNSLENIAGWMMDSPEFKQRAGDLRIVDYVALLYYQVLDRYPDATGLQYWSSILNQQTSRAALMVEFTRSEEAKRRMGSVMSF